MVASRGLSSCGSPALELGLRSCGTWASLLRGMWNLPGPGIEPVSPALAGRFLSLRHQGSPTTDFSCRLCACVPGHSHVLCTPACLILPNFMAVLGKKISHCFLADFCVLATCTVVSACTVFITFFCWGACVSYWGSLQCRLTSAALSQGGVLSAHQMASWRGHSFSQE